MKGVKVHTGLKEAVQGFLFSLQAEGRSVRTYEYYEEHLRHFLQYCHKQRWQHLESIEPLHIKQFFLWVASRSYEYYPGNGSRRITGPSPGRVLLYYKSVRRFFNWAIDEGFLDQSLVKDIRLKPPRQVPVQSYGKEELKRFIDICELDIGTGARFTGLRNKAIILLFIDSALRLNEMARIRLDDLNLDQKLVRVLGKGNKIASY